MTVPGTAPSSGAWHRVHASGRERPGPWHARWWSAEASAAANPGCRRVRSPRTWARFWRALSALTIDTWLIVGCSGGDGRQAGFWTSKFAVTSRIPPPALNQSSPPDFPPQPPSVVRRRYPHIVKADDQAPTPRPRLRAHCSVPAINGVTGGIAEHYARGR